MRSGGLSAAVIAGLPAHTRRRPGRPCARWVDNLTQWSGLSVVELKDAGLHRTEIQKLPVRPVHRSGRLRARQRLLDVMMMMRGHMVGKSDTQLVFVSPTYCIPHLLHEITWFHDF